MNHQWKINHERKFWRRSLNAILLSFSNQFSYCFVLSNYFLLTNNLVSNQIHLSLFFSILNSITFKFDSPINFPPQISTFPSHLSHTIIFLTFSFLFLHLPSLIPLRRTLSLVPLSSYFSLETSGSTDQCLPLGPSPPYPPPLSSLLSRLRPESVGRNCAPGEGGFLSIAGCSFNFFIRPVTLDPL